ncbi:MAG TPA: hypothetical protein VN948_23945 [Terriglobales bacterium]|nr:hypothetical protein [Terriglobales bacterium]
MEEIKIIPTSYRAKIPKTLSYPLGTKTISEALAGVPQFDYLNINFRRSRLAGHPATKIPYQVMEARYSGPSHSFSASKSMIEKGYYSPTWEITVLTVPRSLRHLLQGKLVAEALPAIREWLTTNPHSGEREGGHTLTFGFDELKNELTCNEESSIEWQTARERKSP